MDTKLKKDHRSSGFMFQKAPRINANACKKIALKDISEIEDFNYCHVESKFWMLVKLENLNLIPYELIP